MKKVLCVAACAALVTATGAFAQTTLTITMETDPPGVVAVAPGDTFDYQIFGSLTVGTSEGLALWGADVTFTTNGAATEVGAQMAAGPGMGSFDLNDGLTNPAGYGGTVSGNALLQVGGGQNTINNDSSIAPYPIGAVVTGIADPGPMLLASGSYTTTDPGQTGDTVKIEAGNCFANVIDSGETGPVYAVTAAVVDCSAASVEVLVSGLPDCANHDVDCNGITNALDTAVVTNTLNWFKACSEADDPRADVDRNGVVNALDKAEITNTLNWFSETDPNCTCTAVDPCP